MSSEKIILGIDPGSRIAGFAVIKKAGRKFEYIDSGVMKYAQLGEFLHLSLDYSLTAIKVKDATIFNDYSKRTDVFV